MNFSFNPNHELGTGTDLVEKLGGIGFIAASENGHLEVVRLLLEAGARLDFADTYLASSRTFWASLFSGNPKV